jgi:hypothetical protein
MIVMALFGGKGTIRGPVLIRNPALDGSAAFADQD